MPSIDLGQVRGPTGATGPQGPQGVQGNPGPNQITSATATNLNGVLAGSSGVVGVRPVDSAPNPLNENNLVTSAGVANAINAVENDMADASSIAIVADGDSHIAISSGQYVYVKNNMHSLAEGLYIASANISANGQITSSNVTAVKDGDANWIGGLNDIRGSLGAIAFVNSFYNGQTATQTYNYTFPSNGLYAVITYRLNNNQSANNLSLYLVQANNNSAIGAVLAADANYAEVSVGGSRALTVTMKKTFMQCVILRLY